jgi:tetratricopeptide (TPR) repeat protein
MASPTPVLPNEWLKHAPTPRPLKPGENWNVFLSYRSVNRAWVLNLYDILRQQGYNVFIDQCALKAGDPLIRRLQDALSTSQSGVLIWSRGTMDSEWVAREYDTLERLATEKKDFIFVPVALDGSKLPAFAGNRIYLDFSSYPDGPNGGELLRLLYALAGQPLSREAADFALDQDEAAQIAAVKIGAALRNGRPERIIELATDGGLPWDTSPGLACKAAEALTKLKRNADAIAILDRARRRFPRAVRPKQLYALALARRAETEDLDNAQEILGELYESGERDPETLGIYGRTWMDRYALSHDIGDLRQSRDLYAEAFERAPDDYYTGINAAAKSVLLGSAESMSKADEYAAEVQRIVGTQPRAGDYWWTATVAEVFLIRKQYADARRLYEAAVLMASKEVASHETTWRQACWLMQKLNPTADERRAVRDCFAHLPDCDQLQL